MSTQSVAPSASSGVAALTDAGIGSGLDVNAIVSQLMVVQALPLTQLNNQVSSYQASLSAYGTLTSALSAFQSSLASLNTASTFGALSLTPSNTSILTGTAGSTAVAGNYNVDVTQLAQAQSLTASGQASETSAIGTGAATTLTFQFGTTNGGITGGTLDASVATNGIAAGSLTLDGTTISTSSTTNSAQALATQINAATATTGITATAQNATTGVVNFTPVTTGDGDAYSLTVGGVNIANVGADSSLTAAQLDTALQSTGTGSVGAQLAAAGITFTGSAAAGTLSFSSSSGANLTVSQTLTNSSGNATGGISGLDATGATETYLGSVNLTASSTITVGGTTPSLAGLTAGSAGNNGTFTVNPALAGGTVTIDSSNNTLQGIASAINNANLGVTATIINDGSSTPYHLVFTSDTTGANASMNISASGDSTISNLLSYNPTGTQNLTQNTAAQSADLTVNGIPITSTSDAVSGAIQGVTLNLNQTGSTSVSVAANSSSVESAISSFVTAYNTLNTAFTTATAYNSTTETGGPLLGDTGVQTTQEQIRSILGAAVPGLSQNLNTLQQVGITFQSDGSMALNSAAMDNAVTGNFSSVGALFSSMGTTTDNLVSYKTATSATQPGTYAVNISQLAAQGSEVGSAAPGSTITTGVNDQLTVNVDGVATTVTLAAGTYTPTSLAQEVQSKINSNSAISSAGSSVSVSVNSSGYLNIVSARYSSASQVSLGGDAVDTVLGSAPVTTQGLDVEGTIGGNPASGSGQTLTGLTGSATSGLAISITGGATGSRGTVTYSQGYAAQLNTALTSLLSTSGPIATETQGINNEITGIGTQITTLNKTLAAQQANYLAEFEALDTTIASLDATQTFLTQQLASLATTSSS